MGLGTFTFEFAEESACQYCGAVVPLVQEQEPCGECGNMLLRLKVHDFISEVQRKRIIDARNGGLIIGRSGTVDDIPMFQSEGNGIYSLKGFMHGGEYILSADATHRHFKRLEEINSEKGECDEYGFTITQHSSVLNVDLSTDFYGLWIAAEGQFIINRYASAKYFEELEQINSGSSSL